MDAEAIMLVAAVVVTMTQFAKWSGVPDKYGPIAVLLLSLIGVSFWAWSRGTFERATSFEYLAGFISVATAAAGIFGFTRASGEALAKATAPPSGAGASPTIKPKD